MLAPGSKVARDKGCMCDASNNRYGLGNTVTGGTKPLYIKNWQCPFHGVEAEMTKHESRRCN